MAELTRAQRRAIKQRQNDLRSVLDHPAGARFIARLFDDLGLFRSTHRADPIATAYANGERAAALAILGEIEQIDRHAFINLQVALHKEREEAQRQELTDDD